MSNRRLLQEHVGCIQPRGSGREPWTLGNVQQDERAQPFHLVRSCHLHLAVALGGRLPASKCRNSNHRSGRCRTRSTHRTEAQHGAERIAILEAREVRADDGDFGNFPMLPALVSASCSPRGPKRGPNLGAGGEDGSHATGPNFGGATGVGSTSSRGRLGRRRMGIIRSTTPRRRSVENFSSSSFLRTSPSSPRSTSRPPARFV